jgi:hypothetical protein
VRAYTSGLDDPLTGAEYDMLPWAIAPAATVGHQRLVALLDDERTARAHARATFPAIQRALQLVADIQAWQQGLS